MLFILEIMIDNETIKRFITYNYEKHIRENPGQKIVILFYIKC